MSVKPPIAWEDFEKLDIRTGTIVDAIPFDKAIKPAYKIYIDLGELGILKSSAQVTEIYHSDDLVGTQVICIVNFPPKQIADFTSDCLILGVYSKDGVVLLSTEQKTKDGLSIG
ncbi:MAG: tRNA-binding protein [Bacteroidota bacterium]